jgi:hypothetical protein
MQDSSDPAPSLSSVAAFVTPKLSTLRLLLSSVRLLLSTVRLLHPTLRLLLLSLSTLPYLLSTLRLLYSSLRLLLLTRNHHAVRLLIKSLGGLHLNDHGASSAERTSRKASYKYCLSVGVVAFAVR